jgi:DNA-binding Lrp family transcriptional regulator
MPLCQDLQNLCQKIKTLQKELVLACQEAKDLDREKLARAWKAKLAIEEEREKLEDLLTPKTISANWQNPETGETKEITLNFKEEFKTFQKFYQEQLELELDEKEFKRIWRKNKKEMKEEMEKYGYDQILFLPADLPQNETLNEKLIETMVELQEGKVKETWQSNSFQAGGSWQGAQSIEKPKNRIILVHSAQNPEGHPLLKATRKKNIPDLTGLSEEEIQRRIQNREPLGVNFEAIVENQKKEKISVPIQAESLSMEEYLVFQRIYFEKNQKHFDESDWIWLLKSRLSKPDKSGSRVARAGWGPHARQLYASASDPVARGGRLGCRPSRSFSKS